MGFEHRTKKVLPFDRFIWRLLRFTVYTMLLLGVSLAIGMFGYHYLDHLSWVDSLVNASMILTGMGPVNRLDNNVSKWFASAYAIFSGIAFPTIVAVFLSPAIHRFFHKLHVSRAVIPKE